MDLSELKGDMDRGFEAVGQRFEGVARRFQVIDSRFDAIDRRFEAIDTRFEAIDRRFDAVDQRFDAVDRRFDAVDRRFEETLAFIAAEGEKTRRHFDVVVEHVKSERNLALDKAMAADERAGRLTATNAADHVDFASRLDDHEIRLSRLERKEP
jgi:tetrahydromethanopterin S-methyltransferase subunit G